LLSSLVCSGLFERAIVQGRREGLGSF
jgi:hypothetical protein